MKRLFRRYVQLLKGRDKGTVAITFLLSLPILLVIFGVLVQISLINNARLTLHRALTSAARSAMTSLPVDPAIGDRGGPAFPTRSALMILESLSPVSPFDSSDGQTVADALTQCGATPPSNYASRFAFAEQATTVTYQPLDINGNVVGTMNYPVTAAPRVRITITYYFLLTVPGVNAGIGRSDTVAGVDGRYLTLTSSLDVQLSHGREAPTNSEGSP